MVKLTSQINQKFISQFSIFSFLFKSCNYVYVTLTSSVNQKSTNVNFEWFSLDPNFNIKKSVITCQRRAQINVISQPKINFVLPINNEVKQRFSSKVLVIFIVFCA